MTHSIATAAPQNRSRIIWLGIALLALTTMAAAMPAHADDWHGHRGPPPRHWHRPPPRYVAPGYVYAPPPPPVAYAQPVEPVSTGINLVLPLHFH